MRAIWKGAVSFGLVNVPVKLYSATGEKDIKFHQVHRPDGGRIRYKRVCSVDGAEVTYDEIAKGYETADGQLVVLTDEDLSSLPLATGREIDVLEFVPAEQVDPVLFGKTYYLEPDTRAVKPYALLREALRAADRMAVVKVALRQRETLAVLRVREDVIVLQMLLWPDEVRAADFDVLDTDVELRPQELQMAASLVESLAGDFDPSQFSDRYAEAVSELVESKIASGDTRAAPQAEDDADGGAGGRGGEVVDLLTALQRSVERARGGGSGAGDGAGGAAAVADKAGGGDGEEPAEDRAERRPRRTAKASTGTAAKASTGTAKKAASGTAKKAASGTAKKAASGTANKAASGTAKKAASGTPKKAVTDKRTARKSA